MKKLNTNRIDNSYEKVVLKNLNFAYGSGLDSLLKHYNTSEDGLSEEDVKRSYDMYGNNEIKKGKKDSLFKKIFKAFINPFTAILIFLAIISSITDIILAKPQDRESTTVIIIITMVIVSGILRFVQETRSGNAAENLLKMITTTATVMRRDEGCVEIPIDDIVVGDVVKLSAGDMIPADVRIIKSKDLFVSQSALTGESDAVEKFSSNFEVIPKSISDYANIAFMGSNVISGTAIGIVISVGEKTILGDITRRMNEKPVQTSFEKGVNSVSWLLIKFMLFMVPIVFLINGFTKHNWIDAGLFAISIAVGLTPEMLPMIVTTSLAKGAVTMSKKKTIIKNLNSIQNLGSMNILCTDKTGTLTQDKVVLMYHLDIEGNSDNRVLRHALLNSYYQTGLRNLMDIAIIEKAKTEGENDRELKDVLSKYQKIDEIPFDFQRRRMSVVVSNMNPENPKVQMITKGAVEEMLSICSYAEYNGLVKPLTNNFKHYILDKVDKLNKEGMRVVAVAQKTNPSPIGQFSIDDENDMVLIGYLAFLDPPKESAAESIAALKKYGVDVKILTGDNEKVTKTVCKHVNISSENILLGSDIDMLDDKELGIKAENINVFAKLSPQQKARIVSCLRERGNSVGFMGDGINDATAMKEADVGISVDTAVDIAKESADVILLQKDLMVLKDGIIEGRKTYANMIKYIKMTASSNFGNVFSVLIASSFLPFLPILPIHLIILNLIYDLTCTSIPWDNVDDYFLSQPRKWDASSIGRFMIWFGPTSSIFDVCTYILMYFFICPLMTGNLLFHQISDPKIQFIYIAIFQAGWFVESMWSQTFVIHMLRTPKISFIQSRASSSVMFMTIIGISILTLIPFTSFGRSIQLLPLPSIYFIWLGIIVISYMILVSICKKFYVKKFGDLL